VTTAPDDLTYSSYLMIPELLELQQCRSIDDDTGEAEHDETLFIIIHQVYELWFKQMLHELDFIVERLNDNKAGDARHHLKRVLKILKTLVGQIDILETMSELEALLGIKDRVLVEWFKGAEGERLQARIDAPTLWDAFVQTLARAGYDVPEDALHRDVSQPVGENEALQKAIIASYNDAQFAGLCETLTDLDEGLQEWRYRHVMMVRRTIGTKPGTGGSDGASYLATTLFKPAFPDLWAIRTAF